MLAYGVIAGVRVRGVRDDRVGGVKNVECGLKLTRARAGEEDNCAGVDDCSGGENTTLRDLVGDGRRASDGLD
ncbi:hypothetical protein GN958_ATG22923 [Phytophthora infestans]|uniref:Uncharacterized protein n=1 Tax=Phytophthora infestans TaxID=4787 RepID=A0A8S9TM09_PHYIN|nr:hypothetical protein GN958_ATG22923 [Phytophthora infestans]